MRLALVRVSAIFFWMAVSNPWFSLHGQEARTNSPATLAVEPSETALPDAPEPQITLARIDQQSQPSPGAPAPTGNSAGQNQNPPPQSASEPSAPASSTNSNSQNGAPQSSSSSQSQPQPPPAQKSQHQEAAEQIKQQEHQRIAGILPSFNVSYLSDAASMTAGQKMSLAFHSAIDPFPFGVAVLVAGYSEVREDNAGFGWGAKGYFERTGAAYLDEFNGTMIGNGILPAVFHQDPRYFRLGHGSKMHRLLYAMATSYICKHDNSGRWEPNYSNVGGNIIAGAISTIYYPSQHTGWDQTITDGFVVTTEGTVGGVLNEFWPDISRKLLHKDPTHGLDAQLAAADKKKNAPSDDPPPTPSVQAPAAKAL
jgi:hypothetical protein